MDDSIVGEVPEDCLRVILGGDFGPKGEVEVGLAGEAGTEVVVVAPFHPFGVVASGGVLLASGGCEVGPDFVGDRARLRIGHEMAETG